MKRSVAVLLILLIGLPLIGQAIAQEHYARFEFDNQVHYGLVTDDKVQVLSAGLFPLSKPTDQVIDLAKVSILPPTEPEKVFAVGMNFASHLASRASGPPPLFLKLPSSLAAHNAKIPRPPGADNVHFEGELVLVIGKTAKDVSIEQDASVSDIYLWCHCRQRPV